MLVKENAVKRECPQAFYGWKSKKRNGDCGMLKKAQVKGTIIDELSFLRGIY
ncbi:peroxiredoxin [Yokenella regensburgei]